jgi:histidinol-phosphatase (PHP family)
MIYRADMHVHSTFSCDSTCMAEDHVRDAIEKGIQYICFTEHYDLNPHDEGFGFYRGDAVSEEIERLRDMYGSEITILKGVEFSEPHLYPREFEVLTKKDYDYILASIHFLDDRFILDKTLTQTIPSQQLFERYYHETLQAVRHGGFDAMAHFDYLRRGSGLDLYDKDILTEIFRTMVKQNIALEINAQNERRGIALPFPTPAKAELYARAGGSRITFGSDGHHKGDLYSGIQAAYSMYAGIPGLVPGVFIKRRFVVL